MSTWEDDLFCADRYLDTEILGSILKLAIPLCDSERLARAFITKFGSLSAVVRASPGEWRLVDGVTPKAARALSLMQAALKSSTRAPFTGMCVLSNWLDIIQHLKYGIGLDTRESFRVLFLSQSCTLLADRLMGEGTTDYVEVYPREIMTRSLEYGASKLILVHNHPSGNASPSREDVTFTQRVIEAGKALGVKVYDHVIVCASNYSSMKMLDLLDLESGEIKSSSL